MSYQFLNILYRALDSYTHPEDATLMNRILGVRILFENQHQRHLCKYIPTLAELRERLTNLLVEALNTDDLNDQHIDECYDIALQVGCGIPILQVQNEAYRQHIINRIGNRNKDDGNTLAQIASDSQNVHNSFINKRVKELVMDLCRTYTCPEHIQKDPGTYIIVITRSLKRYPSWHSNNSKALSFIRKNEGRFGIGHTLFEVLYGVYSFIETKEDEEKVELFTILNQELTSMSGKCSTGHMSRLINVLQGFSERYELARTIDKRLIKTIIYGTLTSRFEKECKEQPELVDGILDKSEEYITFMKNTFTELRPQWIAEFGESFSETIDTVYNEYMGNEEGEIIEVGEVGEVGEGGEVVEDGEGGEVVEEGEVGEVGEESLEA